MNTVWNISGIQDEQVTWQPVSYVAWQCNRDAFLRGKVGGLLTSSLSQQPLEGILHTWFWHTHAEHWLKWLSLPCSWARQCCAECVYQVVELGGTRFWISFPPGIALQIWVQLSLLCGVFFPPACMLIMFLGFAGVCIDKDPYWFLHATQWALLIRGCVIFQFWDHW